MGRFWRHSPLLGKLPVAFPAACTPQQHLQAPHPLIVGFHGVLFLGAVRDGFRLSRRFFTSSFLWFWHPANNRAVSAAAAVRMIAFVMFFISITILPNNPSQGEQMRQTLGC